MLSRCLAMLMLLLIAILPVAGAVAAPAAHCPPAGMAMSMAMDHDGVHAAPACDHHTGHAQPPCAMMGLCAMSGGLAISATAAPEAAAPARGVTFRVADLLPVEGLALAPPLEPPRA